MTVDLEITVARGCCNGRMQSVWYANSAMIWHPQSDEDVITWQGRVDWPLRLEIELSGKDMMHDTALSPTGEILQDKFVKIQSIKMARCRINPVLLRSLCNFTRHDDLAVEQNEYFYTNGRAVLEFDGPDPIYWHLLYNTPF